MTIGWIIQIDAAHTCQRENHIMVNVCYVIFQLVQWMLLYWVILARNGHTSIAVHINVAG